MYSAEEFISSKFENWYLLYSNNGENLMEAIGLFASILD